jgi:DnaJ-class molecular chaperone
VLSLVPCFRQDKPDKKYTQVLGVTHEASDVEIKKAYKSLLLIFHPDKNQGAEKEAFAKFLNICEAYEALGDPQRVIFSP